MSYSSFINEELVFAAQAILERSIPSIIDGFRLAQRKIVFSLFKREKEANVNFENKINVTQLASYVSEHAAHHHCERSLSRTIIRIAQNFVGINNLNMLQPIGHFGSRASVRISNCSHLFMLVHIMYEKLFPFIYALFTVLNYLCSIQCDTRVVQMTWMQDIFTQCSLQ